MKSPKIIVAAGVFLLLALGIAALKVNAGSPPAAPSGPWPELPSLLDQEGAPFFFQRLKGQTLVVNFIFTHCPLSCPLQVKALVGVQRALARPLRGRVHFVSVSMDPARDTPPVLKRYASTMGADLNDWSFVTGGDADITWLHQHFDARVRPTDGGQFDHRIAVHLLDANGRFIQRYTGDLDQPRLVREIGDVDRVYSKTKSSVK